MVSESHWKTIHIAAPGKGSETWTDHSITSVGVRQANGRSPGPHADSPEKVSTRSPMGRYDGYDIVAPG